MLVKALLFHIPCFIKIQLKSDLHVYLWKVLVLAPDLIPYDKLGVIGDFEKYLVENHSSILAIMLVFFFTHIY